MRGIVANALLDQKTPLSRSNAAMAAQARKGGGKGDGKGGGKKKPDPADAWRKASDAPAWAADKNRDENGFWILPDKIKPPKWIPGQGFEGGPGAKVAYLNYQKKYDLFTSRNQSWQSHIDQKNTADTRQALIDAIAAQSDFNKPDPPPPTMSNADVQRASTQTRIDAMRRRGFRSTMLAGDTGGYASSATGAKSLLG